MSASGRSGWTRSDNCARVTQVGRRNIEPFDAVKQAMQLVAIEIADELRRIEQRPRPARRGLVDLAQRIAALFGVGRDHDRDVMFGQRHRQFDAGDDIKRLQLDPGVLQQELDRRVAAHVHRRRERKHPQLRLARPNRASETIDERRALPPGSPIPVCLSPSSCAISDEIEPLAGPGRAVGDFRHQLVPQRTQIGAAKRHRREPGKSDPIRAGIAHEIGRSADC